MTIAPHPLRVQLLKERQHTCLHKAYIMVGRGNEERTKEEEKEVEKEEEERKEEEGRGRGKGGGREKE